MKKLLKKFLLILCLAITLIILYIIIDGFLGKYFSADWNFSKSIKKEQLIVQSPEIDTTFFEYKIYNNGEIDFTLKFLDNGIVLYQDSSWFTDRVSKAPIYFTKISESELDKLIRKIKENKNISQGLAIDDHLSGYYYSMSIHKTHKVQLFNKEIGYYNTNPDKEFKTLRNYTFELLKDKKWYKTESVTTIDTKRFKINKVDNLK